MQVVILGAGKIGSYVAHVLAKEEHDVTLIDKNPKILEQIGRDADIATRQSSGSVQKILEDLSESQPDVFFAATGNDETNLVACAIAKSLRFKKTICRIKSEEYVNNPHFDCGRLFQVDHFIPAEVLAAQDLFHTLIHSSDIAAVHFAQGQVQMRTIKIPLSWDKGSVKIKDLKLPGNLILGLIIRKNQTGENTLFPHGEDAILPGDEVTLVGEASLMNEIHNIFGLSEKPLRSAILFGGTLIAEHLANFLLKQNIGVRIVEFDYPRCEDLAEKLPDATIINRDGRDVEFLKGERIKDVDVAIACTYHDGTNMLIASIAKEIGCKKAFALTASSAFNHILDQVGVIPALSAQVNLSNRLLTILHEDTILAIGSLSNDQAKIVEIKVSSRCRSLGIEFCNLKLPQELLIAVIEREGRVEVGRGNSVLKPEDRLIIICPPSIIPKLPELFH